MTKEAFEQSDNPYRLSMEVAQYVVPDFRVALRGMAELVSPPENK